MNIRGQLNTFKSLTVYWKARVILSVILAPLKAIMSILLCAVGAIILIVIVLCETIFGMVRKD